MSAGESEAARQRHSMAFPLVKSENQVGGLSQIGRCGGVALGQSGSNSSIRAGQRGRSSWKH